MHVCLSFMASTETPASNGMLQKNAPSAAAQEPNRRLRCMLRDAETTIFDLVCSRTTVEQWAEWLQTPLEHAVAAGRADLVAMLRAAGAKASAVHPAVRGGQEALVLHLLALGASPSEPDQNGDAPLHVAVRLGHGDILSLLLRHGAAVDALDSEGRSPLHLAVGAEEDGAGSREIVQKLVGAGADLSLRFGDEGFSALDLATCLGHVDIMRTLIHHEVEVDDGFLVGSTFWTALHVGANSNQVGAIDVLVEAGADVDARGGEDWRTPLHVAATEAHSEAVVALFKLLQPSSGLESTLVFLSANGGEKHAVCHTEDGRLSRLCMVYV